MIEGRSIKDDEIHARLVEAIEKPERAHLWVPADAIEFTPHVLPLVYGDGRALFTMATINQRPAYWVIRGCSTWGCDMDQKDATGPNFGEMTDNILTDLEDAFGSGRCGYSGESLFWPKAERQCDCEECQDEYVASWPEVDGSGGCSWSRCDWPEGFETEKNPLSWEGSLLALPSPQDQSVGRDDEHLWRFWNEKARVQAIEIDRLRAIALDMQKHYTIATDALAPFAAVLDEHDPEDEEDFTPGTLVVGSVTHYEITLGDLRRARAALAATAAEGSQP